MKGFRTKKISLPGGKVIEIIYFTEPATDGAVDLETKAPAEDAFHAVAVDRESGLEPPICPSCEPALIDI